MIQSPTPNYNAPTSTPQVASRIDAEVGRIRALTNLTWSHHDRIMQHAKALGFYTDKMDSPIGTLASTPITLRDAIDQLESALNALGGALNTFD